MQLRDLTLDQLRWLHATELHEAFPAEELKPFPAMEQLFRRGAYRPVGAWEGETLVGYALLWTSPAAGYVLIDYLGVTAARRNGGLGGEILRLLQEKFRAWEGILVESEAPEGGPEDALRRRRLGFYQRNGFRPLSYDCLLFGVHYRTFLLSPNGKGTEAAAMEAHRGSTVPAGPGWAYEKSVEIPGTPPALPPRRPPGRTRPTSPGWGRGERMMEYADLSRGILL